VTAIAPDDAKVHDVQELAERVWRSINKTITTGYVTVNARAFSR
jgi:hypothetical protein